MVIVGMSGWGGKGGAKAERDDGWEGSCGEGKGRKVEGQIVAGSSADPALILVKEGKKSRQG
jgi:hypothetical protein